MAIATSTAILAGTLGSAVIGGMGARQAGKAQRAAAKRSADATLQGTRDSIASQEKMFGISKKMMDPFREAGLTGMEQMMALGGMSGPDAQREAMQKIEGSPEFKMLQKQSRQGILSGASATGGLRVGNQRRNRHPRPHSPAMYVWFFVIVVSLSARKYDLKAQAPCRHCSHGDNHSV